MSDFECFTLRSALKITKFLSALEGLYVASLPMELQYIVTGGSSVSSDNDTIHSLGGQGVQT